MPLFHPPDFKVIQEKPGPANRLYFDGIDSDSTTKNIFSPYSDVKCIKNCGLARNKPNLIEKSELFLNVLFFSISVTRAELNL
jgi:hypothetical protein